MTTTRAATSGGRTSGPAALPRAATHSVSSCREYETCPRRYRFAYVDRVPAHRDVPPAWRVGSAVHLALEAAYRHRQVRGGGGPMTDCVPAALASLHLAWKDLRLDGAASLGETVEVVRRFLSTETVRAEAIVGVEQLLATTTQEGLRVAGYADLVLRDGEEIEIRDHKVTRWERRAEDLAGDFQLNLYGWLALATFPWARRVVAAHSYPLSGRVVRVALHPDGMEGAARRVRATAAAIAVDVELAPAPGPHCATCAWAALCPEAAA